MKVYAKTDEKGRLLALLSEAFLPDATGWVKVDEGDGDRYLHAQGHYLDGPIVTPEGVARYQVVAGKIKPRTQADIQADIQADVDALPKPGPSPTEVMYRALAQDGKITPAQALEHKTLFGAWADRVGKKVLMGEYLTYQDDLVRVKQEHTPQAHQPPSVHTAALYEVVPKPGAGPEAWVPGKSYAKDIEVTHKGGVWLSMVDNNTWEPGGPAVWETIWKRVRDA